MQLDDRQAGEPVAIGARITRRQLLEVAAGAGLALGVAGILAACGGGEGSVPAASGERPRIAYIPPSTAIPTEQAAEAAMQAHAERLGLEWNVVGGEFDPGAQIVAVDTVLQGDYDGLVIWPLDPQGIRPSLAKVTETGIPIVVLDSPSAEPHTVNFQLDDYQTEYDTAAFVAAALKAQGKPCNVGVIQGFPAIEILSDRNRGMEEGAIAAGCTILDQQVSETNDATGARKIVDAWKTKFGSEITAILAYNDPSAMGAVALDAIRNGTLLATIAINTAEWGSAIVDAMYRLVVDKEELPETISVDYVKVNADNLADFEGKLKQPVEKVDLVTRGDKVYAVAAG